METQTENTNVITESKPDITQDKKTYIKKMLTENIGTVKIVAAIVVFILIIVCLVSMIRCININEAKTLNADINAITEVSSDDGDKLDALQKRYDGLKDYQKKYVTSYDKLGKCKSVLKAVTVKKDIINLDITKADDFTLNMDIDEIDKFIEKANLIKKQYAVLDDFQRGYIDKEAAEIYNNLDSLIAKGKETKAAILQATPTPVPTPKPTEPPQQSAQKSSNSKSNKYEVLCGVPCAFSDYKVTYNSFSLSSDYEGNAVIIENLTFENFSSEARPFFTTASVTMYQDGVELEHAYFVNGYDAGLGQRKVQQGGKIDVQEAHVLRNKTSPITIEINDWISFNGVKYKGIIPLS